MAEIVPLPGIYRHDQPGYYSLAELPQRGSIEQQAISTGWWELDQIFKLYAGQFVICTGIAGHGKSTFLLNVLTKMAREQGIRSFMYVPENEAYLRDKLLKLWTGSKDSFEHFATTQCFLQSSTPDVYDERPRTLDWVLEKAVVAIERDAVEVVLIDPWNELDRARPKDQLMTDYIGDCLMLLKQFCRSFNVTVIVVAHPTKAINEHGGRQVGLMDIEGSMAWFNKCDNGLIVVRDAEKNSCKIVSAKVREIGAGRVGACFFDVDPQTGIYKPQYGAVL
jgi:twinkle protein